MGESDKDIQAAAYHALQRLFVNHRETVLEIEILPSAISPPDGQYYVKDDKYIGISKKVLVAAFLRAREIFAARNHDEKSYSEAQVATPIILLFDPEHLTAANFRKHHLISMSTTEVNLDMLFRREMVFLDTVLSSPLHRQSKSPTLWYHRYWLVSTFLHRIMLPWESKDAFLFQEFGLIFKSAEQHPNNYYAWQYARRLIIHVQPSTHSDGDEGENPMNIIVDHTVTWCLQHPSDTSGWSFLLFILKQPGRGRLQNVSIIQQIAEFAVSLRWRKEALWHFLRTILSSEDWLLEDDRVQLTKQLREKATSTNMIKTAEYKENSSAVGDAGPESGLNKALEWFAQYDHMNNG